MPTSDSNTGTPDGVPMMDFTPPSLEHAWPRLDEWLPWLPKFRERAVRGGADPNAAFVLAGSTVGTVLPSTPGDGFDFGEEEWRGGDRVDQVLSRVQRFDNAASHLPITGFVVLLANPGKGKSRSREYGCPSEGLLTVSNAASGQTFMKVVREIGCDAVMVEQPDGEDKNGHPKVKDVQVGLQLKNPGMLVWYDEGRLFDQTAKGKHGDGFIGSLCPLWFGDLKAVAQDAATDAATRRAPARQAVAAAMVVCVTPGLGAELLSETSGLSSRVLVVGVDAGASVVPGESPGDWMPPWFDDWAWRGKEPVEVRFKAKVARLLLLACQLRDTAPIAGGATSAKYDAVLALLTAEFPSFVDWWSQHCGYHDIVKTVKLAAGFCVLGHETVLTLKHLMAAMVVVEHSEATRSRYLSKLSEHNSTIKVGERVIEAGVRKSAMTIGTLAEGRVPQLQQRCLDFVYAAGAEGATAAMVKSGALSAAERGVLSAAGEPVEALLERVASELANVSAVPGARGSVRYVITPTAPPASNVPVATQERVSA